MATTRDVNEDYQTYGINHNASMQEFQEQQAAENFVRSDSISKYFVKHMTTGDERIPGKCEELFVGVFIQKRSCKGVGTKDSPNTGE